MSPDLKKIKTLQSLATKLNDTTDSLNAAIESLNSQLAQMNLGLSVWTGCILDSHAELICDGEQQESIEFGNELGYSKADGEWQICVRHVTYTYEPDGYGGYDISYRDQNAPEPLLSASRAIRLEACGLFDTLLDRLAGQATRYINDVKNATKLV